MAVGDGDPVIPVVWLTFAPNTIARGYWDDAVLEDLFSGALGTPPGWYEFDHHEHVGSAAHAPIVVDSDGSARGAVVVIPARHHASEGMVAAVRFYLDSLPWAVVILTGDEAHEFPWREIDGPNRRLWIMTPSTDHSEANDERDDAGTPRLRLIGTGYTPDTREVVENERTLDVFFAGQITHARRQEAWRNLAPLATHPDLRVDLLATESFTAGMDRHEYLAKMTTAKLAPCPSGPCSVDTFRAWEALECGALPLVDERSPLGDEPGFWRAVCGVDPPFPTVNDWSDLGQVVRSELARWPANVNRARSWWGQHKRKMAHWLRDDLGAFVGGSTGTVRDLLTVIVVASPIPSHPRTEILDETLRSIRDRLDCEVLVCFDGVRPEHEHARERYEAHQQQMMRSRDPQTTFWRFEAHHHQAAMTRRILREIETPAVLFVEQDTPLVGEIPWEALVGAVTGQLDMIRLHHEAEIHPLHRHLMLDGEPVDLGVPIVRTVQWSQRPHVANAGWYRWVVESHFGAEARTMIEDVMHGVAQAAWRTYGLAGWERYRLGVYHPEGDIKRSTHTDGRAGWTKGTMNFRYDGEPPEGAPHEGER